MTKTKWPTLALLALASTLSGPSCAQEAEGSALETDQAKVSYAVGLNMGQSMRQQGAEFDLELLFEGLEAGYLGEESRLTEAEVQEVLGAFQQKLMAQQQQKLQAEMVTNQTEAEEFLGENRQREGVQVTESGLQYQVLEAGTGASPGPEDTVTVHYRGTLLDGTEFDSSFDRGEPATFPVGRVIAGWTEALQMMQEGAKWKLFVPPALAYGERGAPPRIGPNELLVFEIELLDVVEPEDEAAEDEAAAEDGG